MIKIFIDKNEAVASVVEKVILSPDADIVAVIPKNSQLKKAISNFQLLKREADAAGKNLLIESVDDDVLAAAQGAGIDAIHSLFKKDQFHRSLSDIVPAGVEQEVISPADKRAAVKNVKKKKAQEEHEEEVHEDEYAEAPPIISPASETPEIKKISPRVWESLAPDRVLDKKNTPPPEEAKEERSLRGFRIPRVVVAGVAILVVLVGGAWILTKFFSRAEIVLTFAKTPWQYAGTFSGDASVSAPDATKNVLPVEAFSQKKNTVVLFDATGKSSTPQKATGKIIIYNAYGTAPQSLVTTTRFETPDGKIFRLDKGVTVPGAKMVGGTLTPASIEAAITADKPGPDYNVGTVAKLTIPGFKGTPKFQGFYGEIKDPITNGATGEHVYPTDQDIASAKAKATDILTTALDVKSDTQKLIVGIPTEFKILDGAYDVQITKLAVDTTTDASGTFSVFGEAQLRAMGFRESDLKDVLLTFAQQENPQGEFRSIDLQYSQVTPDYDKGKLSFSVTADAVLVSAFDTEGLKTAALGKRVDDLKPLVGNFDGSVNIRIWPPFLTRTIPADPHRVSVVVQ